MKVKYANKVFEVLYTKELAGQTMYAVEDEPNHIDWLVNVEVVDADKKELKKIEKNPAWSEEDEYTLYETIQHLEELIRIDKAKHCGVDVQYYQRDIDWLKSLKQRIGG